MLSCAVVMLATPFYESAKVQQLIQFVGPTVAVLAALFVIWRGGREVRRLRELRVEELALRAREFRHKQAVLGLELGRTVFKDPKACNALRMLDWLAYDYTADDGQRFRIHRSQIQRAMRVENLKFSPEEKFIRHSFEVLYDHLEVFENLVKLEVVNFAELEAGLSYYLRNLQRPGVWHPEFLERYDYEGAAEFLARFHVRPKVDPRD